MRISDWSSDVCSSDLSTVKIDKTQVLGTAAQLEVQYEAANSTTALVESYLRQFEAGRKSWLEVLNAQREANDNLMQSIAVRKNYWYATDRKSTRLNSSH